MMQQCWLGSERRCDTSSADTVLLCHLLSYPEKPTLEQLSKGGRFILGARLTQNEMVQFHDCTLISAKRVA